MVVTGKGYGLTNLIALDAQGNIIDEKNIEVEPAKAVLVVQRGNERESYWCNPLCMPTVQLGDDNTAFTDRQRPDHRPQLRSRGGGCRPRQAGQLDRQRPATQRCAA